MFKCSREVALPLIAIPPLGAHIKPYLQTARAYVCAVELYVQVVALHALLVLLQAPAQAHLAPGGRWGGGYRIVADIRDLKPYFRTALQEKPTEL